MKKLAMTGIFLVTAVAVQAAIIASDDFSSGVIGEKVHAVAVQSGSGTWDKAGLYWLEYGAGNLAVIPTGQDSGHAVVNTDYSGYTNVLKVTTTFSVGASKTTTNPGVTVGFYETINKTYLQNLSADDTMGVRLLTSGANEGKLVWQIYDEGVLKDGTFEGSAVAFASTDVIRLTLSYDLQTGAANAEAYNVTQDSLINTGTASVAGVNGFNYAGMGVASLDVAESDSFSFDSVQIEAIPEPATLGMVVAFGGGIMWIRRILMV